MEEVAIADGTGAVPFLRGSDLSAPLFEHFGHRAFLPGQERVIRALLDGFSSLALFPTGGGKSICYQLPGILLPGLTVVVSPLIALMKDQVDALLARGHAAARLDSTLSEEETRAVFDGMESGRIKLLYVAPERFLNERFTLRLKKTEISLLAIDESHCISEWGHNFRPEYLRLAKMAKKLRVPRVLALTATATPPVVKEIRKQFRIAKEHFVQTPFHRPNLSLHITPVRAAERTALLVSRLSSERRFPAIVYATFQETTEMLAGTLSRAGIRARAYHAGLGDEVRSETQNRFMRGETDVIVATIAFGMGIDKADIRSVYHFNLPKTLENYQQEIGRSGRDGKPAHCEALACTDDLVPLQNFIFGDTPSGRAICSLLDHLLRQGDEFDISRYDLSRVTDIRPLVLETVLTYLELDGVLEPLGSFYSTYKIGFRHSEARILAGHNPRRKVFLEKLFSAGKRGPKWLTLDLAEAAEKIGETQERIQKALRHLEEMGDIEIQPSGSRHKFRLLPGARGRVPREIAEEMHSVFQRREKMELFRLQQVVDLFSDSSCTVNHLLRYFGEKPEAPCGHCGNCLDLKGGKVVIPQSPHKEISLDELRVVRELHDKKLPALRSARQLARFLCGISSPAATRDRLSRMDEFGMLRDVPFAEVLAQTEFFPR